MHLRGALGQATFSHMSDVKHFLSTQFPSLQMLVVKELYKEKMEPANVHYKHLTVQMHNVNATSVFMKLHVDLLEN